MKLCTTCTETKEFECFSKNKRMSDGFARVCKACQNAYHTTYYEKNKKTIIARTSAYRKRRPDVQKRSKQKWQERNKEKHLEYRRDWHRRRYTASLEYRLNFIIRGALRRTMDAAKRNKARLSQSVIHYTPAQLRERVEMNFKPGMNWSNYGEWHVDHRVPVARLIRRGVTSPAVINCLANLAPLWAEENMRKGKR